MESNLRILILEDLVDDVELIEHQLKKGDFSFTSMVVETREQYEIALKEFKPDVILSDHSLPMFDSTLALHIFHSYKKNHNSAAAFILVTGTVSEEFAVKIMKEGADDYILKDRLKRLPSAVLNAMEKNRLKDQSRKEEEEKLYLFDILQRSLHEIYVINPHSFNFEYANNAGIKNLGYSFQDLRKLTPSDIIDDFNEDQFLEAVNYSQKGARGLLFERNALRKNQTTYPVQVHLQVIGQGNKKKILANVIDITEAKEFEQQKELSAFIQNSFNYTRDLQESLEIILEKFCGLFHCIAVEFYSREFDSLRPKFLASYNDVSTGYSKLAQSIAQKVYETGTYRRENLKEDFIEKVDEIPKKARIKTIVAIPIHLGTELIAVMVAYMPNSPACNNFSLLSEQVQNKLAGNIKRKKSEQELKRIFEFSPDILAVAGKDGYFRKVNPALEKTLGYSNDEMLKKNFKELIHPDDIHVLNEWQTSELELDEVAHFENRLLTINGDYKCFSWSVTPYMSGEFHFAAGRDITETKRQMQAIQEQNKRLTDIAWQQSHVVRAPLTRLLACVEYLEETGGQFDEILSSIKCSAFEIDKIVKEIVHKSEKIELYGKD